MKSKMKFYPVFEYDRAHKLGSGELEELYCSKCHKPITRDYLAIDLNPVGRIFSYHKKCSPLRKDKDGHYVWLQELEGLKETAYPGPTLTENPPFDRPVYRDIETKAGKGITRQGWRSWKAADEAADGLRRIGYTVRVVKEGKWYRLKVMEKIEENPFPAAHMVGEYQQMPFMGRDETIAYLQKTLGLEDWPAALEKLILHDDFSWAYFQVMTKEDRNEIDQWLTKLKHPMAYTAGTQQNRLELLHDAFKGDYKETREKVKKHLAGNPKEKFKDLSIGDRFVFDSEGKFLGMARGPWIKTGSRKYKHVDGDELEHRVGSINAGVVRVNPDPEKESKAGELFKEFHGADETEKVTVKLPDHLADVKLPPVAYLGTVKQINYSTSKAGDPPGVEYCHKFEGEAHLLAHPESEKETSFLGIVGDFQVKPEGITG